VPYRHAPAEPPSGLRCPRCRADLRRQALGPNQVERCHGCHGVWIAAAEFNELMNDLDRREAVRVRELPHREPDEPITYLACPRCSETMARRNFGRTSGIMVDTCKKHGIWLDRGELRRVVDHLAQRATPESAADGRSAPARRPMPPESEPVRQQTFLEALLDLLAAPFT
jgi:Zn-finger nucleic acid-binding protein